jgi:hypothetical protein
MIDRDGTRALIDSPRFDPYLETLKVALTNYWLGRESRVEERTVALVRVNDTLVRFQKAAIAATENRTLESKRGNIVVKLIQNPDPTKVTMRVELLRDDAWGWFVVEQAFENILELYPFPCVKDQILMEV